LWALAGAAQDIHRTARKISDPMPGNARWTDMEIERE